MEQYIGLNPGVRVLSQEKPNVDEHMKQEPAVEPKASSCNSSKPEFIDSEEIECGIKLLIMECDTRHFQVNTVNSNSLKFF